MWYHCFGLGESEKQNVSQRCSRSCVRPSSKQKLPLLQPPFCLLHKLLDSKVVVFLKLQYCPRFPCLWLHCLVLIPELNTNFPDDAHYQRFNGSCHRSPEVTVSFDTASIIYPSDLQPTSSSTWKETDRNAYSVRAKLATALVRRFLVTEEERQRIRDPRGNRPTAESRTFSSFFRSCLLPWIFLSPTSKEILLFYSIK